MPRETLASLLTEARRRLEKVGIPAAALDARLLLQDATGLAHANLVASPDLVVTDQQQQVFQAHIAKRLAFLPVSKILGHREFYGRRFTVTRDVLDPRPDTETIIGLCLAHCAPDKTFNFIDLGSGSGAIGITLACERPRSLGICVDVSDAALAITTQNAASLGVSNRVTALHSDWFSKVQGQFDLIVSNPPYITSAAIQTLSPDVRDHDPHLALDGGGDGLECYKTIAGTGSLHLAPGGHIVVEIGAGQAPDVIEIFEDQGFRLADQRSDLGGLPRALMFSTG